MFLVWHKAHSVDAVRPTRDRVGVHVWMLPTWHWHLIPDAVRGAFPSKLRAKLPTPKLWRACTFRLKDDAHETVNVDWRRDVGVIGQAWRHRQEQRLILDEHWGIDQLSESAWARLTSEEQLGLTFPQYQQIRAKYHSVYVLPIRKDPGNASSRLIGFVVFDSMRGFGVDPSIRKWRVAASRAAKSISDQVVPMAS